MVPRVAMFTMAGETFLIIGDRDGTGVSPTVDGMPAETGTAVAARASSAVQAKGTDSDLASDLAREGARDLAMHAAEDSPRNIAVPVARDLTDCAAENRGFIGRS
jgi:hypothetical protein